MFENDKGLDTSRWQPAVKLWIDLNRSNPQHRLGGARPDAFSHFLRHHKKALHGAGILVRLPSTRSWLADPEKFAAAVLLVVTGGKLPMSPKAKSRRGSRPNSEHGPRRADRSAREGASL